MALQTLARARSSAAPFACRALGLGARGCIAGPQEKPEPLPQSPLRPFSTAAAAATPTPSPAAATNYIPGRADAAGTAQYAQKIGANAGPGHFRALRAGGPVGDLIVSSVGIGTYMGPDNDAVDREYIESITRSLTMGINFIDCASNFRTMRSELLIGQCLERAFKQGIVSRNEVVVCSKAGFLAFDYRESIDPYTYIDETYIKTKLFERDEFVGGCHCLTPAYLKNQLELSRRNMGLETIDVYFIHNPEIQLNAVPRATVMSRIKAAMAAMEECANEGKISMYGVSTWNGFRLNSSGRLHLSLEELVNYAKELGGENHHFKIIQAPYNGFLQEAAKFPSQSIKGRRMPLLHAAHHLGVSVVASASLNQGNLCKNLNPDVRNSCPELGEQRTDAQSALQFVRTTPGIMTALAGMRQVMHVEENGTIIRYPAHPRVAKPQPAAPQPSPPQ